MNNVTLSASAESIERARRKARSRNTTLNAEFRAGSSATARTRTTASVASSATGRSWTLSRASARAGASRETKPMSAEAFLDTNIFVYTFDRDDASKRDVASRLVEDALRAGGCISLQVGHEFLNVATRKFAEPMGIDVARRYLHEVLVPLWKVSSTRSARPTMAERAGSGAIPSCGRRP